MYLKYMKPKVNMDDDPVITSSKSIAELLQLKEPLVNYVIR